MGGNQATQVDRFIVSDRHVDIHITARVSDWYWAVMSIMGFTTLAILALGFLRSANSRVFFYILSAMAFMATIEYYSMASNLGWIPIDVQWQRSSGLVSGANRQIWWVRYCGWFLIWPLLSLALLLTCAAPTVHILWACFLSCVMAAMALIGAVVRNIYKWGYFGFWAFSWLMLGYCLVWGPRPYARALGRKVWRVHTICSIWIWFLWMFYPVCWGLSEGGNVITPDSEFIFYGILDCCLIPLTCGIFLGLHWKIDPLNLGLYIRGFYDPIGGYEPVTGSGALQEKADESANRRSIRNKYHGSKSGGNWNVPSDAR
ncbi:hypothetical protein N7451_009131 [Penicillium sp. IBT 35674x]|nr:hypothetical protein N7451_009131 [Penicillium sp. IBT 35674x]